MHLSRTGKRRLTDATRSARMEPPSLVHATSRRAASSVVWRGHHVSPARVASSRWRRDSGCPPLAKPQSTTGGASSSPEDEWEEVATPFARAPPSGASTIDHSGSGRVIERESNASAKNAVGTETDPTGQCCLCRLLGRPSCPTCESTRGSQK